MLPEGVSLAEYEAKLSGEPVAATEAAKVERPAYIPEKFWDAETGQPRLEEAFKSYSELEKGRRGEDRQKAGLRISDAEPAEPAKADEAGAGEVAPITVAIESFAAKYAEAQGKVTQEDVASLVAQGLPQTTVDTYLAGLEAIAELQAVKAQQYEAKAFEIVGGKDEYAKIVEWASATLSDAEIAAFDKQVSDPETVTIAVEWLSNKYKSAFPSEGKFLQAETSVSSGDLFHSDEELYAAMGSPEYKNNENYRNQVQAKIERSLLANSLKR